MGAVFADERDVFALLDAAAFVPRARRVQRIVGGLDLIIPQHGIAANDVVTARLEADPVYGAPATSLPTPLAEGTSYYAIVMSAQALRLAASAGGAAIALTGGSGLWSVLIDPVPKIRAACARWSDSARNAITAHSEIETDEDGRYPGELVTWVARNVLREVVTSLGMRSEQWAKEIEGIFATQAEDDRTRERWRSGAAIVGAKDKTPELAEGGAVLLAAPDDLGAFDLPDGVV